MNGVHDMGGQQNLGPVHREKDEPVFHAEWEGRIYALNRAIRAWRKWSVDTDRHALEVMHPEDYLRMSYYERWLSRLEAQLVTFGLVTSARSTPASRQRARRNWSPPSRSQPRPLAESRHRSEPRAGRASVVQGGSTRSRAQHASPWAHAPSPVRARQGRCHHARSRCLPVPRHERAFPGREASTRVFRAFCRSRVVGRPILGAGCRAPGHVGRLP